MAETEVRQGANPTDVKDMTPENQQRAFRVDALAVARFLNHDLAGMRPTETLSVIQVLELADVVATFLETGEMAEDLDFLDTRESGVVFDADFGPGPQEVN